MATLPTASPRFRIAQAPKSNIHSYYYLNNNNHICSCKASKNEEEYTALTGSTVQTQLQLLEQLTSSSDDESGSDTVKLTIREQLSELVEDRNGEFSLPLGKKFLSGLKKPTISQKRNIKRQTYLNEVSRRNDSVFFATVGAFVIIPPIVILSIAIITGYVQLLP